MFVNISKGRRLNTENYYVNLTSLCNYLFLNLIALPVAQNTSHRMMLMNE